MTDDPVFLTPRADTLYDAFAISAARYPDNACLHMPAHARVPASAVAEEFSYAALKAAVDRLADTLAAAGYGLGHRIAVALDNSAAFFIHYLACNRLGVSLVPLNAAMAQAELVYLISHSDAALVISAAHHGAHIRAAAQEAGAPVIIAGEHPPAAPPPLSPGWTAGLQAEAAILYTSGTTGKPKGCMLSNEYIVMVGEHYSALGGHCTLEPGQERLITPLPVNHMNAMACSFVVMVMNGGCLIQLDRFHSSSWWDTVRASRATCLHYLGVMPAMLLAMPARADDDFSGQIRFGFGAGVDPRHQVSFEQRFGFPLIEAWAMTETGAGGWMSCEHEPRHVGQRCIGLPRRHMEVKLVDEAGADCPVGTPGELLVRTRGPDPRRYFFTAYYKDDAATAEAWAGDWFHTGDVVKRDAAGYYYFVDRNKNIVRRSGENIAAVEVESILAQLPGVAACAIVPVPDEMRGEEVCAMIQPRQGSAADVAQARALQAQVAEALVYFKAPGYVGFVETLPQTASQKLARGELKRLARDMLEAGTLIDIRDGKRGSGKAARAG